MGVLPSETFLHLREDKKKKLLDSSMEEFSKHLLEDVSINQIIKNAGISRGSFYTYFTDKEDLYIYLINLYKDEFYAAIFKHLEKSKGDFIEAWKNVFADILEYCVHAEHASFFKNIFLNLRFSSEKKLQIKPPKEEREKWKKEVLTRIDKNLYRIQSEEDLLDAFSFVMMMTNMSIVYTFMNQEKEMDEKKKYENRLDWFQYGIYKEEEK